VDGLNWMQFAIVRTARRAMTPYEVESLMYLAERADGDPALRKRLVSACAQIVRRRAKTRKERICR